MARYRDVDMQPKFIPVDFAKQILPGTFEHALHVLIDDELDLSPFSAALKNDLTGAPAYHPGVLLKIVLFAYSRGIISSRRIEAVCRDHIIFIALSGDSQPHFSTIAAFVADHGKAITHVFTQVLMVCDRQGLIGRDMFAIDGVKLPSNAAKAKSGRRADFEREAAKIEAAVTRMIEQHQSRDATKTDPDDSPANVRKLERMKKEARTIRQWLEDHPTDRPGAGKATRLSNRTDNESAKMATDKGVVQGYCGVAAVDQRHQIIVEAQAHGTGSEQGLLPGIVDALQPVMHKTTVLVTDAGYHSDANVERLEARKIDAYIADNSYRQRDERYADQGKHKDEPDPLWDKRPKDKKTKLFRSADFQVAEDLSHCLCPAGKRLYRSGANCNIGGHKAVKFKGAKRDCIDCPLRAQCLRHPERTPTRSVAVFLGRHADAPETASERMKRRIDSPQGRDMISRRFATVEPVFGNIRYNKRLDRFTLRSRTKVDGQWKLYCLVHNIEKLAHHGYRGEKAERSAAQR
jgi:transposase